MDSSEDCRGPYPAGISPHPPPEGVPKQGWDYNRPNEPEEHVQGEERLRGKNSGEQQNLEHPQS